MQTKLKGLRAEHGVTQADMADLLGVTRQTYTEKENGNQPFKADELFIISGYFDKPIEQMAMDDRKEYISSWIIKNTTEFFKDAPELGDEYLRQLRKSNEENKFAGDFSKEFIEKTAKIAIQNDFYYGKLNIIKLDLENEPVQIIKK